MAWLAAPLVPQARAADLGPQTEVPTGSAASPGDGGTQLPLDNGGTTAPPPPSNDPPSGGQPPTSDAGPTQAPSGGGADTVPEQSAPASGGARSDGAAPAADSQRGASAQEPAKPAPRPDASGDSGQGAADTKAFTAQPLDDIQVDAGLEAFTGGTTLSAQPRERETASYAGHAGFVSVLGRAASANRIEQRNRVVREAKQSTLSRIAVIRAPDGVNNPLFSLFGGGGGAPAAVLLIGFLAVLGATSFRAPGGMNAFIASTVTWRPSAYVPPIESPG